MDASYQNGRKIMQVESIPTVPRDARVSKAQTLLTSKTDQEGVFR